VTSTTRELVNAHARLLARSVRLVLQGNSEVMQKKSKDEHIKEVRRPHEAGDR
jgi:hypothetical protein